VLRSLGKRLDIGVLPMSREFAREFFRVGDFRELAAEQALKKGFIGMVWKGRRWVFSRIGFETYVKHQEILEGVITEWTDFLEERGYPIVELFFFMNVQGELVVRGYTEEIKSEEFPEVFSILSKYFDERREKIEEVRAILKEDGVLGFYLGVSCPATRWIDYVNAD